MYKIQTNSLAIKSQNWIAESLLKLMDTNLYKDITITQICQEANLVRKTFYRNFDTKEDILDFIFDNLFDEFKNDSNNLSSKEIIYSYYNYWSNHKKLLKLLYENNLFFIINRKYMNYAVSFTHLFPSKKLRLLKDSDLECYVLNFIAYSMSSILELWVQRDFKESVDSIAKLTEELLANEL